MVQQDLKKQLELHSLIEFSNLINSNLDEDFILNYILLSIMGRMMISHGMILMSDHGSDSGKFNVRCAKGISSGIQGTVLNLILPDNSVFDLSDFKVQTDIFERNGLNNFFKIYYTDKLLGVLCLGNKSGKSKFDKSEIIYIETLLNISSISIENSLKFEQINKLNRELSNELTKMNSLFELSNIFYSNFEDKDKIIRLLNYTLLGNYGIRDILIITKYRANNYYILSQTKTYGIPEIDTKAVQSLRYNTFINDKSDSGFFNFLSDGGLKLAIPIFKNDKVPETVVFLGNKLNGTLFSKSDIDFLTSLVNLSVISIENSILFREHLEKLSLENELKIAREIQQALLPTIIPQPENYSISAINKPALHVGGDYFDIIRLNETKYVIVIADVSGKGAPAALLMSNIQSAVRSYIKVFSENIDIALVTKKINELIFENTTPEKFITFFWGILDTADNTFRYVNAGHNYPMLFRKNGDIDLLDAGGMIIGVISEDIEYETGTVEFNPDEVLILYTDGINEAKNNCNDEYEMERFKSCVMSVIKEDTSTITSSILKDVNDFTDGEAQSDDRTLIVIKRIN